MGGCLQLQQQDITSSSSTKISAAPLPAEPQQQPFSIAPEPAAISASPVPQPAPNPPPPEIDPELAVKCEAWTHGLFCLLADDEGLVQAKNVEQVWNADCSAGAFPPTNNDGLQLDDWLAFVAAAAGSPGPNVAAQTYLRSLVEREETSKWIDSSSKIVAASRAGNGDQLKVLGRACALFLLMQLSAGDKAKELAKKKKKAADSVEEESIEEPRWKVLSRLDLSELWMATNCELVLGRLLVHARGCDTITLRTWQKTWSDVLCTLGLEKAHSMLEQLEENLPPEGAELPRRHIFCTTTAANKLKLLADEGNNGLEHENSKLLTTPSSSMSSRLDDNGKNNQPSGAANLNHALSTQALKKGHSTPMHTKIDFDESDDDS